jgi:hypothetical protein
MWKPCRALAIPPIIVDKVGTLCLDGVLAALFLWLQSEGISKMADIETRNLRPSLVQYSKFHKVGSFFRCM